MGLDLGEMKVALEFQRHQASRETVFGPLRLVIRNWNYMLVFENLCDFVHQAFVRGLGDEMQLDGKGGVVTQPLSAPHITETTVTMGFRFMLADPPLKVAIAATCSR